MDISVIGTSKIKDIYTTSRMLIAVANNWIQLFCFVFLFLCDCPLNKYIVVQPQKYLLPKCNVMEVKRRKKN